MRPFSHHQKRDDTLQKYTLEVSKFIAFLLCDKGEYKLPLDQETEELISAVHAACTSEVTTEDCMKAVEALLVHVWMREWSKSAENSIRDPTMCYIALSSIREDLAWAQAKEVTGPLAKFTYCI